MKKQKIKKQKIKKQKINMVQEIEDVEEMFFEWADEAFGALLGRIENTNLDNDEIFAGVNAFCHEISTLADMHFGETQ